MSSIATAVFKATIGLLVNIVRDKAAEKLQDGDITDHKFRSLIVREIDDIKSKLDGLARKDLLASISFFKEGIELLYEVFDKARSRSKCRALTSKGTAVAIPSSETFALAKRMRKLELTDFDESAKRALANAKDRFKDARREATKAFANEALETSDRVLAMRYRVMATILETVDNPEDALAACRVCIEELHSLQAVQKSFSVEIKKGFWALFSKDERKNIISSVCHVNRVIYDVTLMTCLGNKALSNWPIVHGDYEEIDPLRDVRVAETLRELGMEHFCVTPRKFGQEGEEEHKLKKPRAIATNTSDHFIIADHGAHNVKVFDSSGRFLNAFHPTADDENTLLFVHDVATDSNDYMYTLVTQAGKGVFGVYVFDSNAALHHKFPLMKKGSVDLSWMTVSDNNKILVLQRLSSGNDVVDVYESDGQFVRSFGDGILHHAGAITASNDGCVMVVDNYWHNCRVHRFSELGQHLNMFEMDEEYDLCPKIAFHWESEHALVASSKQSKGTLRIYTTDGDLKRSTTLLEDEFIFAFQGITVTAGGRIAAVTMKEVINLFSPSRNFQVFSVTVV